METRRTGPFVLAAVVIVGCLVTGVWMSMSERAVPSLTVSVVLACAVASLLYCILGGVGKAGFNLGPIKMGGSAAVLIGSVYLFDMLLEPQLDVLRQTRLEEALEQVSFDFERDVSPPTGWFAIDRETGAPVSVRFTDPVGARQTKTVHPPERARLRLMIGQRDQGNGHLVSGVDAEAGLGYVNHRQLKEMLGALGELVPHRTYGPKRLHLVRSGELPPDKPRTWGLKQCVRNLLPLQLSVERFYESSAVYEVRPCDSDETIRSSLSSGTAELHQLMIEDRLRSFVIAVVAADHRTSPFWSSFLVIELVEGSD